MNLGAGTMPRAIWVLACWVGVLALAGTSLAASDAILDADYESLERPLSSDRGGRTTAGLSAKLGYMWRLPDGTHVLVLSGAFRLDLPHQQLTSHDAVVWLSPEDGSGRVKKLDVFMEGDAQIVERAGAVTADQVLFATVYTAARIELVGDALAAADGSDQPIYKRALRAKSKSVMPATALTEEVIVHPPEKISPRPPRVIHIKAGQLTVGPQVSGVPVLIATGGVYVIQSGEDQAEATELRSASAVLFLKPGALRIDRREGKSAQPSDEVLTAATRATPQQMKKQLEKIPTEEQAARELTPAEQARMNEYVSAAYLEGDVVLSRGYRQIRASRIYYDFERTQATIHNLVAFTEVPQRNVPVYVRASLARQLSETEYVAYDAKISTSEFYTPSYHVGATKVFFEDRTQRIETGERVGLAAGRFKAHHATLNVGGWPVLYWPYLRGDFKQSETAIKNVRASYDSEFGTTAKTRWHLFTLLGLDEPEGMDGTLHLNYYGDRGPAAGIDLDYERDTYLGLVRSFWIHDTGEDQLGGIRGDVKPPYRNRGRFLLRHKHFLPDDWELNLELSYLSDVNFLEEYFRSEFDEGKEQETLIYLKKAFGENTVFSILAKWRLNDFQTQVEQLPEAVLDVLGKPLFDGRLTWYSENRVGSSRYRVRHDVPGWLIDATRYDNTGAVARGDSRQEVEMPLTVGPVKLVPFGVIRGTAWDHAPFRRGGTERIYGAYGVRASMYQWRVYDDVESRLFDLHRLRHIMKEDATLWASHANRHPGELTAFDRAVEGFEEIDGVSFGWRNRFQTKRGGPGNWRTVDWLTLDLEFGFFSDGKSVDLRNRTRGRTFSYRPEYSIANNFASLASIWRISDTTALLYDTIIDIDDGAVGSSGLGLHVDRDPRTSWFVGHRYIRESDSNLLAFGGNYRLSSKYTVSFREEFDLEQGRSADLAFTIVRRMPRWFLAVTLEFDETENVDSVSLAIWPQGVPEWTIGSRRYTGLETSTGLRP